MPFSGCAKAESTAAAGQASSTAGVNSSTFASRTIQQTGIGTSRRLGSRKRFGSRRRRFLRRVLAYFCAALRDHDAIDVWPDAVLARNHRRAVRRARTSRMSWSLCAAGTTSAVGERSAPLP